MIIEKTCPELKPYQYRYIMFTGDVGGMPKQNNEIWINKDYFEKTSRLLPVMVEELIHAELGFGDCTNDFHEAFSSCISRIIDHAYSGKRIRRIVKRS